ncbi:hypothetical protein IFR05_013401 [Cadophora sp. M221]|nr:hypothetical protein IFR05_013401 [Cadophora sp. M221]
MKIQSATEPKMIGASPKQFYVLTTTSESSYNTTSQHQHAGINTIYHVSIDHVEDIPDLGHLRPCVATRNPLLDIGLICLGTGFEKSVSDNLQKKDKPASPPHKSLDNDIAVPQSLEIYISYDDIVCQPPHHQSITSSVRGHANGSTSANIEAPERLSFVSHDTTAELELGPKHHRRRSEEFGMAHHDIALLGVGAQFLGQYRVENTKAETKAESITPVATVNSLLARPTLPHAKTDTVFEVAKEEQRVQRIWRGMYHRNRAANPGATRRQQE